MVLKGVSLLLLILLPALFACEECTGIDSKTVTIDPTAVKWVEAYSAKSTLIFSDSLGGRDTIMVIPKDTIYERGGICTHTSEAKEVHFQSKSSSFNLLVAVTERDFEFSVCIQEVCFGLSAFSTEDNQFGKAPDFEGRFDSTYLWNGNKVQAASITLTSPYNRTNFTRIVYSREFGLLEFSDPLNKPWIKEE